MPNAQLGLPAPGAAGSLGANKAIVINTPAGATTRSALLYPFPANDNRNISIGSQATYDSRSMLGTGGARVNDVAFGLSVKNAGYAYVAQQDTAENHHCDYQPDGNIWGFNTFMGANLHTTTHSKTGNSYNVTVIGNAGQYERATKMSGLAGPLRLWEMQAALAGDITAIRHVLDMGLCSQVFNAVAQFPAFAVDSFAASNTGYAPYGGRWGIPPTVPMPSGLNPLQQAYWWTGVNYGFQGVDASGQGGTFSVVEAEAAAHSLTQTYLLAGTSSSDVNAGMLTILGQARLITNHSQANPGGPGTRLDSRPVPAFA